MIRSNRATLALALLLAASSLLAQTSFTQSPRAPAVAPNGMVSNATVVTSFPNAWHASTIGLTFNPAGSRLRYAHEGHGTDPLTIWDVNAISPFAPIGGLDLSALNPGFPVSLNDRDGAAFDPATGTYFLPDFNGDLALRDDNLVEINAAGTILNAWELDGAGNDSSDATQVPAVIDIALIPGTPNRYFVSATGDAGLIREIELTRAGQFVAGSWRTLSTCTVAGGEDLVGIEYDASNGTLLHASFSGEVVYVTDLACNVQSAWLCDGPGTFHTGVTVVPGSNPRRIFVTDFQSNQTTVCDLAAAGADLSVVLADSPDPVAAGSNITYTATASNNGPAAATDLAITIAVPAGTSFVSANAAGGACVGSGPVICTWLGATAVGTDRVANVVVAVPANAIDGSIINNAASVTSATPDPDPADNTATAGTGVITAADLTLTLADAPDPVVAGTNLSYTATLANAGPSDAQNARFSFGVPAGTSFVSATPTGGSCSGTTTVTCTWAGATAPGVNRTATIVVAVAASVTQGTSLLASATATSDSPDPVPGNNGANASTTVNANANLSITLTDTPDPVTAGNQLTYVATLTNGGPSDAQGANISLPLPAGTSFVSVTPSAGGSCNAASPVLCTWAGATVPGGTRSATVVALVAPSVLDGTVLSATATAASSTTDPTPGNNTASATTTVIARADLSITLGDSPDPVVAGTQLSYVATLGNAGPSDAQNASITLPLPAGTSFVSAAPNAGGSCNASSPVVCTWAGATAPGGSRSVTIVVLVAPAVLDGTVLTATATAGSSTTDPTPGNNSATTTTAVIARADLTMALTDNPDPVIAGTQLTYVATLGNAGPSDAQAATITLPLPAGTSFVSATPSAGGSCNAASPVVCSWAGGTAPGSARTATIVALVAPSVLEGAVLTATATASSTTTDPNPGNNSATTTTNVIARADLQIGLASSHTQVLINVPVTFTATSLNAGPSDAQTVSVTVTLTPDFRYSSHVATGATCTTPQIGNTGAIVCTWAGATAPGVTRTLTVVAFSNVEGNTGVNASTTSATVDPNPDNNAANISVVVGYPFNEIPTLGQWGLLLLGLLMAGIGFVALRRQG